VLYFVSCSNDSFFTYRVSFGLGAELGGC
jgi:hypothetical protein